MVDKILICLDGESKELQLMDFFNTEYNNPEFITKSDKHRLTQAIEQVNFTVAVFQDNYLTDLNLELKKLKEMSIKQVYLIGSPTSDLPDSIQVTDNLNALIKLLNKSKNEKSNVIDKKAQNNLGKDQQNINQSTKVQDKSQTSFLERGLGVRKKAFTGATWDRSKTIGIWSPLAGKGVTTFSINLALYLAKFKVPVAVLEGISKRRQLKLRLQRFSDKPREWQSFAQALFNESVLHEQPKWVSNGVSWVPLNNNECSYEWTYEAVHTYINTIKVYDILLVDLPTGEMSETTTTFLEFIDELWIIADHLYPELMEWHGFMEDLKEKGIPLYMIFPYTFPFSENYKIADKLGIDILAEMPPFDIQTIQKGYLKDSLLIDHPSFKEMEEGFNNIKEHLNLIEYDHKDSWWNSIKKKFSFNYLEKRS